MSEYITEFERPLPAGSVISWIDDIEGEQFAVVAKDTGSNLLKVTDPEYGHEYMWRWMRNGLVSNVISIPAQEQEIIIDDIKVDMHEKAPHGIDQHAPGAKLDSGKIMAGVLGDFSLALQAVAEVGTFGAEKYTRGGWQHVPNGVERYTDAMWRHLLYERHDSFDADSGLLHAAHLAWNALSRLELMLREKSA